MALKPLLLSILLGVLHLAQGHNHNTGHDHQSSSSTECVSNHCHVQLSPDLLMRYRIHLPENYDSHNDEDCKECNIKVQMIYDGYTWLGVGVSLQGKMVGSHAIIGQPGISDPKLYYLGGKDIQYIKPSDDQPLEGASIEFVEEQTIMEFTTSFFDWGVGISLSNPSTFIYANGADGEAKLGYHGPQKKTRTINNLLSLSSSKEQSMNSVTLQANIDSTQARWMAHGILAFVAWGILAPLALSTAILRDCNVPSKLKPLVAKLSKNWLQIHIGLNTSTYIYTLIVFSIAVSTINRENDEHWEHAHSKMGLAIFVIASFQILGGYFRPSPTLTPSEEESALGNEEERKVLPMKSTLRQAWELLHNLLGIALFLFGVWQMYEGIELYQDRYSTSKSAIVPAVYIAWMGVWTVIVMGATVYKWFFQKSEIEDETTKDLELSPSDIGSDLQEFT